MSISIITNKKVDKTFEGEDCLLKRSIISTFKKDNYKKYIILTERCNYYDVEVLEVDENGIPILDDNGDQTFVTESKLKILSKKDTEGVSKYSFEEINGLYLAIQPSIPSGLSKMDTEDFEEKLALLVVTQQESPWSTNPVDWEIL